MFIWSIVSGQNEARDANQKEFKELNAFVLRLDLRLCCVIVFHAK